MSTWVNTVFEHDGVSWTVHSVDTGSHSVIAADGSGKNAKFAYHTDEQGNSTFKLIEELGVEALPPVQAPLVFGEVGVEAPADVPVQPQ